MIPNIFFLDKLKKLSFTSKVLIPSNYEIIVGSSLFLADMIHHMKTHFIQESHILRSEFLKREVVIDCYIPHSTSLEFHFELLLINDGQDLVKMHFGHLLDNLFSTESLHPLFCVGIHCSAERRYEYGTANVPDYQGYGVKAHLYTEFILQELLPFLTVSYGIDSRCVKSFAGFSLGGLSALDIVWNYPTIFKRVGVFSGSLWWRDRAQEHPEFNEETDRIMHRLIREGSFTPGQKFFFEVGTQDETADRNNNGIIDSIDDTLSLIEELVKKGYDKNNDIRYLELEDGKHDIATWAKSFPDFLRWGWKK